LRHQFFLTIALVGLLSAAPGVATRAQAPPIDPIAALAADLKAGARPLAFSPNGKGYAPDLLRRLKISEDSQVLVFSKTSLQVAFISPANPRAIYFNDDVSLGLIPGAPLIEMWAVGRDGAVRFYTLKNTQAGAPQVQAETDQCEVCHKSIVPAAPGPLMQSVSTLSSGTFLFASTNRFTDGRTPVAERWGGWYVTGRHGQMQHRGNAVLQSASDSSPPSGRAQNLTSLAGRFDLSHYSRPTSDIVALMTLEHESGFLNLANAVRALAAARAEPEAMTRAVDQLADYMLGADGAVLTAPVKGLSGFTERFAAQGEKDSRGRSLREFDLQDRLFRYPVSFMIYSSAFDALPAEPKAAIYRRLAEVLSGRDRSAKYARLTPADRLAALEIVGATKHDLPTAWPTAAQ
jgi:hypothetical protein